MITQLGLKRRSQTLSAVRVTYGQAHASYPALAAASPLQVNPQRIVCVITVYLAKPVSYPACLYGYCPPFASKHSVEVSAWPEVMDAATGEMTDSCVGCVAAPHPGRRLLKTLRVGG